MVSSKKLKVGGLLGQTHLNSSVFMAVVDVAHGKGLIRENEPAQRSISTCNLSNSRHHQNISYDILTFFTAFIPSVYTLEHGSKRLEHGSNFWLKKLSVWFKLSIMT